MHIIANPVIFKLFYKVIPQAFLSCIILHTYKAIYQSTCRRSYCDLYNIKSMRTNISYQLFLLSKIKPSCYNKKTY